MQKKRLANKILAVFITFNFLFDMVLPSAQAQSLLDLPQPGSIVSLSELFNPSILQGVTVYYDNPFQFDFILNPGSQSDTPPEQLKEESRKLIKYFLAAMTVPEDDLWVNLSPYEKDKIIAETLGRTEMGRDMLAQDYILKQLSSSLIYPEEELGKDFWQQAYQRAYEKYGTTDIPINTFNKVWIVPEKAVVFEKIQEPTEENPSYGRTAFVAETRLKVMLEEDYLAMKNNQGSDILGTSQLADDDVAALSQLTSNIYREIILPQIEREVNEGENFARLRQIYNSMILAAWYKMNLKESILAQVYADKNKLAGVAVEDEAIKDKIYAQYLEALKKGVFDYIKEDYDRYSDENIPRKYFAGGAVMAIEEIIEVQTVEDFDKMSSERRASLLRGVGQQLLSVKADLAGVNAAARQAKDRQDATTDQLIISAISEKADWIKREFITKSALEMKTSKNAGQFQQVVDETRALLNALIDEWGLHKREAAGLKQLLALLDQMLAQEDYNLDYLEVVDYEGMAKALGLEHLSAEELKKLIPFGHASDRGIHLFRLTPEALIHELMAFAGLQHPESVAFEMALSIFNYGEGTVQDRLARLRDELVNEGYGAQERFWNRLTEDNVFKWVMNFHQTFSGAVTHVADNLAVPGGRSKTLLADLSARDPDAQNLRDMAMAEEQTEMKKSEYMSNYLMPDSEAEYIDGTRQITFRNGLYSLRSKLIEANGRTQTRHVFEGHAISDLVLIKEGNQVDRPWKEILDEMDSGYIKEGPLAGMYHKEGQLPNNSYNDRFSDQEIQERFRKYLREGHSIEIFSDNPAARRAKAYLKSRGYEAEPIEHIYVLHTAHDITFGIAKMEWDGKSAIVIEQGFLDRIKHIQEAYGNDYDMLARSMLYLLADVRHEEGRALEYEYAKEKFPGLAAQLPIDVEKVLQEMIIDELEPENAENRLSRNEIIRKCRESLLEIGVHMLNRDVQPDRVRWDDEQTKFVFTDTGNPQIDWDTIRVGFYPGKSDPMHFGHIESALRFMASRKLSIMSYANQRFDFRKSTNGLMATFDERFQFTGALCARSHGLFVSPVTTLIDDNGESNYLEMIPRLDNRVRARTVELHYLAGGDHAHVYSPDYKKIKPDELQTNGSLNPAQDKLSDGTMRNRPDVIQNILDMVKDANVQSNMDLGGQASLEDLMKARGIKLVVNFNTRELFEVLPLNQEVKEIQAQMRTGFVKFLPHLNLPGIYSQKLRDTYSGKKKFSLTFLPVSIQEFIKRDAKYQGWMTQLPHAIRRIANNDYKEGQEKDRLQDIAHFRTWLKNFNDPSAEEIARMFTLDIIPTDNLRLAAWKKAQATAELQQYLETKDLLVMKPETVQKAMDVIKNLTDGHRYGETSAPTGGIDFTPAMFAMEVRRDEKGVPLPLPQQPVFNMQFDGLVPVIIEIVPLTNLNMLMGFNIEEGSPVGELSRLP